MCEYGVLKGSEFLRKLNKLGRRQGITYPSTLGAETAATGMYIMAPHLPR
jgi:hypothetical protein